MSEQINLTEECKKQKLDELCSLIPLYVHNKREADSYSKIAKSYNESIKTLMKELGIDSISDGDNTIKFSVTITNKMDEVKMFSILKSLWVDKGSMQNPYTKYVETVDMDKVESALYNGEFSDEVVAEFATCDLSTHTEKITISKTKKKVEED